MNEDPEGISPGESAKGDRPRENRRTEGPLVSQQAESLVVKWETLLARAGCKRPVIAHARAVTDLALRFADSPLVNRDLVLAGAMLHDIGRGVTHEIDHAQRGADLARSLALDEGIVLIIERHIGAGMTADECSLERIIPRDCVPGTVEEKIVANADNLVDGDLQGTIEGTMEGATRLKRRVRKRIYRLYLEMESFRR